MFALWTGTWLPGWSVKDSTVRAALNTPSISNRACFQLGAVCTHSVLLRPLSSLSCSRLMTAWPRSLSGPTRARCRTWTCSAPPWLVGTRSKAASSLHTGATLFSATDVWYFSLPTCMTAYASLVPLFPFTLRPLAWSTVTWTLVGHHCWSIKDIVTLLLFFLL